MQRRGKKELFSSLCASCFLCALPTCLCYVFRLPEMCGAGRTHNTHLSDEEQEKRRYKGKSSSSCLCVMYHSLSVFPLLYTTRVARVPEGKSTGEDVVKVSFHDQL